MQQQQQATTFTGSGLLREFPASIRGTCKRGFVDQREEDVGAEECYTALTEDLNNPEKVRYVVWNGSWCMIYSKLCKGEEGELDLNTAPERMSYRVFEVVAGSSD